LVITTARLTLRPVDWRDLPDLTALKSDPGVFAVMLGGVRTPAQTQADLATDLATWGKHGVGIWTVRDAAAAFAGIAGIMDRPDGRGLSLRFAIRPELRGKGIAREAAAAALRDALDRAGLPRVIAVTRASNTASRTVLGSIGMRECEAFARDGYPMLTYEAQGGNPAR
jgi:RimJ/RimL family protein N-acetyltransferase